MTILLCIIVFAVIIPDNMQKRDARVAYDMGNYEVVYELLYGKDLNEEEEILLHKSTIVMKMERKINSYRNYLKLNGKELEALNALVQGAALYYELLPEADEYFVLGEVEEKYQQILAILSEQYRLSEADVMDIINSEDDVVYTQKITAVLSGLIAPEEATDGVRDVLPEEQEILDGLPEEPDIITDDILNNPTADVLSGSSSDDSNTPSEDISDSASDAAAGSPDGMVEGTAADGTASDGVTNPGDEVKYIEPVSVEVHQNN